MTADENLDILIKRLNNISTTIMDIDWIWNEKKLYKINRYVSYDDPQKLIDAAEEFMIKLGEFYNAVDEADPTLVNLLT